ncbi:hypothetical protein [Oerskovia flava]|uniref:hypothetical protein n=1 Tax=Oerskovia flava TaxID=2986422 RepID=UPI00223EE065|nr:hypothetical protein [Oerskovia sp. JB1-3-2]
MRIPRTLAALSVTGLVLIGSAACADSETPADATATTEAETADDADVSEEETEEPAEEETEDAEEVDSSASGDVPEWANPVTTPGEQISSLSGDDFQVDVYQVGTTEATKTGQFADPETNEPLIDEGDEIVFVNYVITNTGDEPIQLGSSLVNISARYDDWPYMQGMDSIVDSELFEAQEVNDGGLAAGSYVDPSVYVFEPGQTFSYGQNFAYQSGSPITFSAVLVPVDSAGDLRHDVRQEVEGTGTIS